MEELRRAREAGDDERVEQIREELKAGGGGGRLEQFLDQVEPILRDDQRQELARIREEMTQRREEPNRPSRDPLAQLKQLRGELELSEEQATQYDAAYGELETQVNQSRGSSEDINEIVKQLMEAAEAGDKERIEELRKQLPDPRGQTEEAIAAFMEKLGTFLTDEQMQTVEDFRDRMPGQSWRGEPAVTASTFAPRFALPAGSTLTATRSRRCGICRSATAT